MKRGLTEMQREYLKKKKEEELLVLSQNQDLIRNFKDFVLHKGITLSDADFQYIDKIGIVANQRNIVQSLCPEIQKDKEGLIKYFELLTRFKRESFSTGCIFADKYVLLAHPYFRRRFYKENHFSPRFIELFWHFINPEIETSIALDNNMVRINLDRYSIIELDTWYGAKFNNEVNKISDGTVKLRPPLDLDDFHVSFCFSDVYTLDIKWHTANHIKSFYAEEFKSETVKVSEGNKKYHPARYIHAEFDLNTNCFRHFDGAIHLYSANEYFIRRDADFDYDRKETFKIKPPSVKLFKMNGKINIETWLGFTCQFLSGNPLVFEYFEGDYPVEIKEIIEAVRKHTDQEMK